MLLWNMLKGAKTKCFLNKKRDTYKKDNNFFSNYIYDFLLPCILPPFFHISCWCRVGGLNWWAGPPAWRDYWWYTCITVCVWLTWYWSGSRVNRHSIYCDSTGRLRSAGPPVLSIPLISRSYPFIPFPRLPALHDSDCLPIIVGISYSTMLLCFLLGRIVQMYGQELTVPYIRGEMWKKRALTCQFTR